MTGRTTRASSLAATECGFGSARSSLWPQTPDLAAPGTLSRRRDYEGRCAVGDSQGQRRASRQPLPPNPGAGAAPEPEGVLFRARHAEDVYEFREGSRMRFGRDDGACEIPVWEHIETRADTLSRVAGELLCDDGTMWVRNLSESHELRVRGAGEPGHTLGRRQAPWPAPGRSLPFPFAELSVPSSGNWRITVEAVGPSRPPVPGETTVTRPVDCAVVVRTTEVFPAVPTRWQATARALCLPLLTGDGAVASTYAQVAELTEQSRRQARRAVDDLCNYYEQELGRGFHGWQRSHESRASALARLLVDRGAVAPDGAAGDRRASSGSQAQ